MTAVQTFDHRQPIIVNRSEIRSGDWMNDRGSLWQVDYVDLLSVRTGGGVVHIVHFKPQQGVKNLVRGISEGVTLTVWRG